MTAETIAFQTEVSELLQLMVHSLYSDKDIFGDIGICVKYDFRYCSSNFHIVCVNHYRLESSFYNFFGIRYCLYLYKIVCEKKIRY